ncbi:MAG TPA: hypothetical protein VM433_03455 [Mycobacteriales bacterium]|nr:hypothetical protein [Mycobacteriales bacterium]
MTVVPELLAAALAAERQAEAAAHNRAARLRAVRRYERRAEEAGRRARLVRLALHAGP